MLRSISIRRFGVAVAALALARCSGQAPIAPPPALAIVCPPAVSARAAIGATTTIVAFAPAVASGGKAPVTTTCTQQTGAAFPVGSTSVSCTAADVAGQSASCSFVVTVDPAPIPRLALSNFMAFGDSLTEGKTARVPSMVFDTSYTLKLAAMLRTRYPAQAIIVVNEGLGGEPATEALKNGRFDSALNTNHPEVLLLMDGANDIFGGNQAAVPGAAEALDVMGSRAAARGIRVFIATLPPEDPSKRSGGGAAEVRSLNDRIVNLANARGWTLVDVYAAFNGDLTLLGSDGLHPTDAGHQVIAQTFYDRILAKLESIPGSLP